jgi:hypothetical protein
MFTASKGKYEIELIGQEGCITGSLGYGKSTIVLTKDGKEKTFKDAKRNKISGEFIEACFRGKGK